VKGKLLMGFENYMWKIKKVSNVLTFFLNMLVAGAGFEPTTFGL
jgi:hypothetical protein